MAAVGIEVGIDDPAPLQTWHLKEKGADSGSSARDDATELLTLT